MHDADAKRGQKMTFHVPAFSLLPFYQIIFVSQKLVHFEYSLKVNCAQLQSKELSHLQFLLYPLEKKEPE